MNRPIQLIAAAALLACVVWPAAADTGTDLTDLESAAARDDPKAQTELAAKYESGDGVAQDYATANRLYCLAAKRGNADAQFKIAWVYANGRGVEPDDAVAAAFFNMAAEQGNTAAGKLLRHLNFAPDTRLPPCDPSAVAEELDVATRNRGDIEKLVHQLAPQYSVDPRLALAVISVESAFNPSAVSPKSAQGLMQLIPGTAERFGVKKVFNPAQNIKGGLAYLRWLLAYFKGDVSLVLAAYNAGEKAVDKYRGIPPYAETRNYVRKITGIYKKTSHPYESDVVEPSPLMAGLKRG